MIGWDNVEYIQNILVTVDGGQSSSSIYGNERNCAAVTISFNGMNDKLDDPFIDLHKVDIGPYTCLIDYDTGETLRSEDLDMLMSEADEGYGLFYSYSSGKFCNSSLSAGISSTASIPSSERRAQITYYVYGKCRVDMRRMVAARIALPNGKLVSTDEDDGVHKVDLLIKRPIMYCKSDLEPISWRQVFEIKNKKKFELSGEEYVAFIKLKREFGFDGVWTECEFENFRNATRGKNFIIVSKYSKFKGSTIALDFTYVFQLGEQGTRKLKLGLTEFQLEYNQEPNALCVVFLKAEQNVIEQPMADYRRIFDEDGLIKLYDSHGNLGEFKLNFDYLNDIDNSMYPAIVNQNI